MKSKEEEKLYNKKTSGENERKNKRKRGKGEWRESGADCTVMGSHM